MLKGDHQNCFPTRAINEAGLGWGGLRGLIQIPELMAAADLGPIVNTLRRGIMYDIEIRWGVVTVRGQIKPDH